MIKSQLPRRFRPGYGEYLDRMRQENAERCGKVVRFLREHPLSTSQEVFNATGCGVIGNKWVTWTKYNGQTVWRLNHPKMREHGLE